MVLEGDRSTHYKFEQLSFCILVVSFIVNFSGFLLLFFWEFSFASYFTQVQTIGLSSEGAMTPTNIGDECHITTNFGGSSSKNHKFEYTSLSAFPFLFVWASLCLLYLYIQTIGFIF